MQTFVVLMIGMAFGSRLGVATVLLYLAEGAAGLPVFAGTPEKGIGIAYMMGTTGGYLLGFVLAAGIVGALATLAGRSEEGAAGFGERATLPADGDDLGELHPVE